MENIVIRKITADEVESAMNLALPFYLALGFIPLSEEQEINGIRFTPMKYSIKR